MKINTVIADVPLFNAADSTLLDLTEGDVLNSRVAQVKGDMVMLVMNSNASFHCHVTGTVQLKEGQLLTLVVKGIEKGKVVLEIINDSCADYTQTKTWLNQAGIKETESASTIVRLLIEEGLPVTEDNVKKVMNTGSSIRYIINNLTDLEQLFVPEDINPAKTPVERLAKWILEQKSPETACMCIRDRSSAFKQIMTSRISPYAEMLSQVSDQDIINIIRTGAQPSLFNLDLVSSLRLHNGFIKSFLQHFFDIEYGGTKEFITNCNHKKIYPVDLTDIVEINKTDLNLKPYICAVIDKISVLSSLFEDAGLYVFSFAFDKKIQEAIILVDGNEEDNHMCTKDVQHLYMITDTDYLGKIEVYVIRDGRELNIRFYTETEESTEILLSNRHWLTDSIQKSGYRVSNIDCIRNNKKQVVKGNKCFDMRV